jgi:hypothetical protein
MQLGIRSAYLLLLGIRFHLTGGMDMKNIFFDEETATGILFITKYPRVPINKTLWPYHVDKG